MEDVYTAEKYRMLYTKKIDLQAYMYTYSQKVMKYYKLKNKDGLMLLLDIESSEEFKEIKATMCPNRAKNTYIPKSYIPKRRFLDSWPLYELPYFETSLSTLNNLRTESRDEKYKRMRTAKYQGKIVLEEEKEAEEGVRMKDLVVNHDYLVCVRVLSMIGVKKYTPSQEMWVPGKLTLERIKDRIICQEDFELADPSVNTPDQANSKRLMDVNKFGMFYIGDTFYVDKRWGNDPQCDYSVEVREWAPTRGIDPGKVEEMGHKRLCNIPIRLGYPYLFMHQGNCEHLIVFTDARLVKCTDVQYCQDYPILISFALSKGRYCVICLSRLAKLCVTDCSELPYDNSFICQMCALSYLYDERGIKKYSFSLYKYVDRSAII